MSRVLYLHGFASGPSSSKARYFASRIPGTTVLQLDGGYFEHLTISGQLEVVDHAAGGNPVTLIGSSMGAWIAGLYAARHPEVDRLVMLAPALGFNRRWAERLGPAEMDRWKQEGAIHVFHYGDARIRKIGYQLMQDAARYEDFPDVGQPTLILHGAHDDIVPAVYAEEFAANRPNVRLEIVDSGHDLLNVLETIGGAVAEFLAAGSGPGRQ